MSIGQILPEAVTDCSLRLTSQHLLSIPVFTAPALCLGPQTSNQGVQGQRDQEGRFPCEGRMLPAPLSSYLMPYHPPQLDCKRQEDRDLIL